MKWLIFTILFYLTHAFKVREITYFTDVEKDIIKIRAQYPLALFKFGYKTQVENITIWDDYARETHFPISSNIKLKDIYWNNTQTLLNGLLLQLVLPKINTNIIEIRDEPQFETIYPPQRWGSPYSGYWTNRGTYHYW